MPLAQGNGFRDGASDAADFETAVDDDFFQHVGHQQIVFGDQDFGHRVAPQIARTRRRYG
jgi:hypothetical protein